MYIYPIRQKLQAINWLIKALPANRCLLPSDLNTKAKHALLVSALSDASATACQWNEHIAIGISRSQIASYSCQPNASFFGGKNNRIIQKEFSVLFVALLLRSGYKYFSGMVSLLLIHM